MTANQSLKPITTRINEKGNLEIGGCDTVELADKYGTPLYVYDEATIRTIANEYKHAVCGKGFYDQSYRKNHGF